jgi:hypothetical protein
LEIVCDIYGGLASVGEGWTRHRHPMPKDTPPDIPPEIADRPRYVELTPDEERTFLQKLAGFEAAFRQTRDSLRLWEALNQVWQSGQTVPHWLAKDFLRVIMLPTTGQEMRRASARWWAVRRYQRVRNLRETVNECTGKKYTRDEALDQAVIDLRAEGDKTKRRGKLEGVSRDTVEDNYDKVRRDLEQRGRESQYYFLVNKIVDGGT